MPPAFTSGLRRYIKVLDDGPQGERRQKVSAPTSITMPDEQQHELWRVGGQRAGAAGWAFLAASDPAIASTGRITARSGR
jgi:hypothetical protein